MKRIHIFIIAAIILGTLSSLVLSEIILRVVNRSNHFIEKYRMETKVGIVSAHYFLNHTLSPNMKMERPESEIGAPPYLLQTNALGFKFDLDRFKAKGKNCRIAILGDSQIEGEQAEFTLPSLFEKRVKQLLNTEKIEVMNWGVQSYSPLIHYVNLRHNVLRYNPDMVIMHVDMTDVFDDNVRYKPITQWDSEGNPLSIQPAIMFSAVKPDGSLETSVEAGRRFALERPFASFKTLTANLIEYSFLFRVCYYKLHTPHQIFDLYDKIYLDKNKVQYNSELSRIRLENKLDWCVHYDDPEIQKQIQFTLSILLKIKKLLDKNNVPLVIIATPLKQQLVSVEGQPVYTDKPIKAIRDFCAAEKIPFHCPDMKQLAEILQSHQEIYFNDGAHLNYTGKAIWADSLAKQVAPMVRKIMTENR